jgi:cathepsin C
MKFIIFKFLLVITLICLSKADIPVHCLKSQIIGKWKFYAIEPNEIEKSDDLYNLLCGHEIPSKENTSYLSLAMTQAKSFNRTFVVEFTKDQAISEGKVII